MGVLLSISRPIIATLLLVPLFSLFFVNILCTIDNINNSNPSLEKSSLNDYHSTHHSHEHDHSTHHSHGHDHSNHHNHDNGKENLLSNKSESEEDCCNDITTAFFTSFKCEMTKTIDKSLTFQSITFYVLVNRLFSLDHDFKLYSDKRPPPKLYSKFLDIRIFIQSFQI